MDAWLSLGCAKVGRRGCVGGMEELVRHSWQPGWAWQSGTSSRYP